MARGVKPRETIRRMSVWCGGSVFSMMTRCISIASLVMPSSNRTIAVFSQLENSLSLCETAITSACRVTAQKPVSPNPVAPVGCSFHQTGADRRSSANSSVGTRWR